MRVLIVDDAAFMRTLLKNILTRAGHQVVGEARNGIDGIEKYKILKPDLVTMDITMPDMDGITCLKKIREVNSGAKVVMCSAMGQRVYVVEAIKEGAKDFIVKPFHADKVLEVVEKLENK